MMCRGGQAVGQMPAAYRASATAIVSAAKSDPSVRVSDARTCWGYATSKRQYTDATLSVNSCPATTSASTA